MAFMRQYPAAKPYLGRNAIERKTCSGKIQLLVDQIHRAKHGDAQALNAQTICHGRLGFMQNVFQWDYMLR
jgi:hypothetical protein